MPRSTAKLKLVEPEAIDITAALRADINARDWSRCHIEGDKRAPVFLADALKRVWR